MLFCKVFITLVTCFSGVAAILTPLPPCDTSRGLTREQVKLCNEFYNHMQYIMDGKQISLNECKKRFAGRRWNCTFPHQDLKPVLRPKMTLATRETGVVNAMTSAGAMHTISRACMENKLASNCACSEESRPANLPSQHVWGGCGDNLPYGYKFSKRFTDASEELLEESLESFSKVLMNLHNNEVGRWAVYEKSIIQCRCHGASSNCATKMCYRQLGNFKEVGKYLDERYQGAIQVKLVQKGEQENTEMKLVEFDPSYIKYTPKDLIYLKESPSYCHRDLSIGSFGTSGRKCQTGTNSLNHCNHICCDRGYQTRLQLIREKCGCQFIWCCEVKCKMCETEQNVHYCK
nr:Wnt5 protein [Cladonema pacificum]